MGREGSSKQSSQDRSLGTGSGTGLQQEGHGVGSGTRRKDVCAATGTWTALEGKA